MARALARFLLTWLLVVAPSLCGAGLLEHACDCGHSEGFDCGQESSCDECCCTRFGLPQEVKAPLPAVDQGQDCIPPGPALPAVLLLASPRLPAEGRRFVPPPWPPGRARLPYAPSDRPLLI